MAYEKIKRIFKVAQKGAYVVVLPKDWVMMHELDKKRDVKMIVDPEKIVIMPLEK